jgi:hypothetical protein
VRHIGMPERVERMQALDWCLRQGRPSPDGTCGVIEAEEEGGSLRTTTIVISSRAASPLSTLAEALDVLLLADEARVLEMTEPTAQLRSGPRGINDGVLRELAESLQGAISPPPAAPPLPSLPRSAVGKLLSASKPNPASRARLESEGGGSSDRQQEDGACEASDETSKGGQVTPRPNEPELTAPVAELLQLLSEGIAQHVAGASVTKAVAAGADVGAGADDEVNDTAQTTREGGADSAALALSPSPLMLDPLSDSGTQHAGSSENDAESRGAAVLHSEESKGKIVPTAATSTAAGDEGAARHSSPVAARGVRVRVRCFLSVTQPLIQTESSADVE